MKKIALVAAILLNGFYLNAQPELFRVAFSNSTKTLVSRKPVKVGDTISAIDTIQWTSDSAALKLYGTTHKKICLVGKEMRKLSALTIEKYLSLTEEKGRENGTQQRFSSIRTDLITLEDTIYVLDTMQYKLPEVLSDEGTLELHLRQGNTEVILPADAYTNNTIIQPRSKINVDAGEYEVVLWIKNEENDWHYPILRGLWVVILPDRL